MPLVMSPHTEHILSKDIRRPFDEENRSLDAILPNLPPPLLESFYILTSPQAQQQQQQQQQQQHYRHQLPLPQYSQQYSSSNALPSFHHFQTTNLRYQPPTRSMSEPTPTSPSTPLPTIKPVPTRPSALSIRGLLHPEEPLRRSPSPILHEEPEPMDQDHHQHPQQRRSLPPTSIQSLLSTPVDPIPTPIRRNTSPVPRSRGRPPHSNIGPIRVSHHHHSKSEMDSVLSIPPNAHHHGRSASMHSHSGINRADKPPMITTQNPTYASPLSSPTSLNSPTSSNEDSLGGSGSGSRKRFVCGVCAERFTRKYNMETHERTHDAARAKPFVCEQCSRGFDRKHDLKRHIDRVHLGERPYPCPRCDKKFGRKDVLTRHLAARRCCDEE